MVKFLRYKAILKLYEKIQPYIQYSLHVENDFPSERALVLAPHMDDESIGCGGTLLKLKQAEKKSAVVFFTSDTIERKKEAEKACGILGVKPEFLNYKTESLKENIVLMSADIQRCIEENKPGAIFVPFFLDNHTDHRALNVALKNVKYEGMIYAYPVWSPLYPNVLIDISSEWEEKKRAIECYQTQLISRDYVKMSSSLGQYWASVKGKNYTVVETFFRASLKEYLKLCGGVLED